MSRDPIAEKGGLNLYGYVLNDPVNLWDPLGLDAVFRFTNGTTQTANTANDFQGIAQNASPGSTDQLDVRGHSNSQNAGLE